MSKFRVIFKSKYGDTVEVDDLQREVEQQAALIRCMQGTQAQVIRNDDGSYTVKDPDGKIAPCTFALPGTVAEVTDAS